MALDDARFVRDASFDADRYFKDTVGITSGSGGVQEFRWAAAPLLSHYLDSQPIHASQRRIDIPPPHPGWACYAINVHPTYELNQWILGFGADALPLGPDSWVDQLRDTHRKALDRLD